MDIYVKTPGLTETEFGGIVQSIMGTPAATPPPLKPGEKPTIIGKTAPPVVAPADAAARQLMGKPAGIYESDTQRVTWDGKKVTAIEAKKVAPAPAYNFGTF